MFSLREIFRSVLLFKFSDTFKHRCIDNLNAQGISEWDNYNPWITTTYLDTMVINLDKNIFFFSIIAAKDAQENCSYNSCCLVKNTTGIPYYKDTALWNRKSIDTCYA